MANTGFKGVNVRQTGTALLFRAFLQTSAGALVTTGTTNLYLVELQSDGTINTYDWSSNTFKSGAVTTENQALTYRKSNNATTDTGLWTFALTTLTGFTVGAIYIMRVNNSGASPTDQMREFQYGSAEGDMAVIASGTTGVGYMESDAEFWKGGLIPAVSQTGVPIVDPHYWGGTAFPSTATAGIPDVNAKNINNVSTSSVATINANQGTTQPVNFTGTAGSALVQVDIIDWKSGAVPTPNQTGVPIIDLKYILGTLSPATAGYIGPDWGHVNAPTTVLDLTQTTIKNLDGNTVQTGDSFAIVNNGTYGNSALHTQIGTPWQVGTKYNVLLNATDVTGNVASDLQTIKTQTVTCGAGVTIGAFVGNATHAIAVDSSGFTTFNNAVPANFSSLGITSGGKISEVALVDVLTTYTNNTPQTGDSYARLGAPAGASVSADIAAIKSETDTILTDVNTGGGAIYARLGAPAGASMSADIAAVKASVGTPAQASSLPANFSSLGITVAGKISEVVLCDTATTLTNLPAIPANWLTAAGIASGALIAAVWDGSISGHTGAGTFGGALNAAGSAGDPWATFIPGAYGAGTAGYIVGHNLTTTGVILSSAGLDDIVIETGLNARQALSIIAAANGGTSSGVAAGTPTYHAAGVPGTTRITAVAVNGDRSSVTLNPPA